MAANRTNLKADLKATGKSFDRAVQRSKRQYWRKCQKDLSNLNSKDPREFWKKFGQISIASERKHSIPWEVVLSDGSVSNAQNDVLERWQSDFSSLLNQPLLDVDERCETNLLNTPSIPIIDTGLENPITLTEVKKAISNAKSGKAVGCDDIPTEVLDNANAVAYMHSLFQDCYANSVIPSIWKKGIISPIPKDHTSDPRDPMNFRGITLACSMYKLYCSVLNMRMSKWTETNKLVEDEQNGFRSKRSCIDQVSSLTNIIETRKCLRKSTYALFVDFRKAFDCINRQHLWYKLSSVGLTGKMLSALQSIYSDVKCCVRVNSICSDYFDVQSGLKQGCLLSPGLFNLFINDLVYDLKNSDCGVSIGNEQISVLGYADDLVCVSESEEGVQSMLDILDTWCNKWNMNVNVSKTQIVHFRPMCIAKTEFNFTYRNSPIQIVSQYKYLGLIMTEFLDFSKMAYNVAQSAGRALGLLIAKSKTYGGMPYDCFTKLFDSLVQPIIDYGAAIWGTKDFSCIQAVQHRACRFLINK